MALPSNDSTTPVSEFLLILLPNFQSCLLFLLAMGANTTLLITIQLEASLHQPLYYLLSLLSLLDIVLCLTVSPKVLAIFWFGLRLISFPACFLQMFIMNSFLPMESCTFMVMAYDRYVAVCHPLRYPSIITNQFVAKASVFIVVRNALFTAPIPILTSLLHYCGKNVIENCICANLSVSRLSCDNFTLNRIYQFVAGWTLLGLDFILIFLSYTFILRAVLRFKAEGAAVKARKKVPMDILILFNVLHYLSPPALSPIACGFQTKELKQEFQKLLQRGLSKHGRDSL
uniref:G-protein coupled receptors family 1 profile domain-containing protein n=1 Tax=Aotus nancymaae TaxID=37293 RepID=A0A2K5CJ17_AOTNA